MFTDGYPDSESAACSAARQARNHGIQIIAIGTGDADLQLLANVTSDPNLVLWADPGEIAQAFEDAQAMIAKTSLVDAQAGTALPILILRVGLWTSLLASGLGLALIAGQNRYLRRRFLSWLDLLKGGGGSVVAGFLAGVIGQTLFWIVRTEASACLCGPVILGAALGGYLAYRCARLNGQQTLIMMGVGVVTGLLIASLLHWLFLRAALLYYIVLFPAWILAGGILGLVVNRLNYTVHESQAFRRGYVAGLVGIVLLFIADAIGVAPAMILTDMTTRIIGWIILGAVLGRGMALFVPNLDHLKAMLASSVGGLIGAITFLLSCDHLGEMLGRILGVGVLGSSIGLMTALVELASRDLWLEVSHNGDVSSVNLGRNPVIVDDNGVISTKSANGTPTAGLRYGVEDGRVTCEDLTYGHQVGVSPGTMRTLNKTTITIHGSSPRP